MVTPALNLARKWRSKQFNQVVGQELPIRMLQNSLYVGQIFPVYLFSGQRGCGKTTTARLFAAALNCAQLEAFRTNPREHNIPCLACPSCLAMAGGNHPDFIEIDAASHTGVDNVRHIIDAASLLPVMGARRVYLIDEAHMLSKAAFNAFLKILEEPPASVVFMLATTDPQKILETVRSRCFQLFFNSIEAQALVKHLQEVCAAENIQVEVSALQTIVQETEGSARDALNLLEQVRFSHAIVTQDAVLAVLGHMTESMLFDLFESIVHCNHEQILMILEQVRSGRYASLVVWEKLQELTRIVLALKHKVQMPLRYNDQDRLIALSKAVPTSRLITFLKILFEYEMTLLKSTAQEGVLSLMIMTMATEFVPVTSIANAQRILPERVSPSVASKQSGEEQHVVKKIQENVNVPVIPVQEPADQGTQDPRWTTFLASVDGLSDPLLRSIFKQGQWRGYDETTHKITIAFPLETKFFGEWLQEAKSIWLPLLQAVFGQQTDYIALFENGLVPLVAQVDMAVQRAGSSSQQQRPTESAQTRSASTSDAGTTQKRYASTGYSQKRESMQSSAPQGKKIDVSDKETWKVTNTLLDAFGGTVVEIEEKHTEE